MKASELFEIKKEERWLAVVACLIIGVFQYLIIAKFFVLFANFDANTWEIFAKNYHMSGFDDGIYRIVSDHQMVYDYFRHPLLTMIVVALYPLNQLLWTITGINCTQILVSILFSMCTFYSVLFYYRILRTLLGRWQSYLLTAFFFGFAYILIATFVADHFCLSLFVMLLTLYMAVYKRLSDEQFSMKSSVFLVLLAAGITLTNGVVVWLMVCFTNGKGMLSWRKILAIAVLPMCFLMLLSMTLSSQKQEVNYPVVTQMRNVYHQEGTNIVDNVIENFFGESIQLHRKHVLGDVLMKRPLIVRYTHSLQYVVEGIILFLFMVGLWYGRHYWLCWLCMAIFAFSFLLHIVIGFASNEVYIMASHWAYVIPVIIALLLKGSNMKWRRVNVALLTLITIYLWIYHSILLYNYLTWPLKY